MHRKFKRKEGGHRKIRQRLSEDRSRRGDYKNPVFPTEGSAKPAGGEEGAVLSHGLPDEIKWDPDGREPELSGILLKESNDLHSYERSTKETWIRQLNASKGAVLIQICTMRRLSLFLRTMRKNRDLLRSTGYGANSNASGYFSRGRTAHLLRSP